MELFGSFFKFFVLPFLPAKEHAGRDCEFAPGEGEFAVLERVIVRAECLNGGSDDVFMVREGTIGGADDAFVRAECEFRAGDGAIGGADGVFGAIECAFGRADGDIMATDGDIMAFECSFGGCDGAFGRGGALPQPNNRTNGDRPREREEEGIEFRRDVFGKGMAYCYRRRGS